MKYFNSIKSIILLLFVNSIIQANGIGIIDGEKGVYLKLINSEVNVQVDNQIATIKQIQVYKNTTGNPVLFKYGTPLNESSNPISFRWFVDGKWKKSDISKKVQNNSIPGSGGGKTNIDLSNYLGSYPFLISLKDTIQTDSFITIELTYVELLPYFLGKVNMKIKNNLAEIYKYEIVKQSFSFTLHSQREIQDVELIDLSGVKNIDQFQATISHVAHEELADFDYQVEYELSSNGLGIFPLSTYIPDSLLHCDSFGNGFVTMIIEPESNVNTEVIEKNFTLIIDRSGSMSGNKIVQAKDAASFIVNNLNDGDYFNIIDFSSDIKTLFRNHIEYNISNQNTALDYIDKIIAGGSTNISGALTTAIDQFLVVDTSKANIIIFFTDGEATAGETSTSGILRLVEDQVNKTETSIFLFTLGIGQNLSKTLLTLLARQNKGLAEFINDDELEDKITKFFLSINNPVLINTQITFSPDIIHQNHPTNFPNLYKGQQLIVSGRYKVPSVVNMHLEGQAFNVPVSYDFTIDLSDSFSLTKTVLPKIWAKQKIDDLAIDFHLSTKKEIQDDIKKQIDSVSVCYGIIATEFNSFVDDNQTEVDDPLENNELIKLTVSPNPINDKINVKVNSKIHLSGELKMTLFDLDGKVILNKIIIVNGSKLSFIVDVSDILSSGMYFGLIQVNEFSIPFKIIKQ